MSLFPPKGDYVWESNCTLKQNGIRPKKLQSAINFSYKCTQIFGRHPWKRNWNALPMSLFSWQGDYVWESNCTLKHSGVRPRKLKCAIPFLYKVTQIFWRHLWKRYWKGSPILRVFYGWILRVTFNTGWDLMGLHPYMTMDTKWLYDLNRHIPIYKNESPLIKYNLHKSDTSDLFVFPSSNWTL